jgi:hypothetical protein
MTQLADPISERPKGSVGRIYLDVIARESSLQGQAHDLERLQESLEHTTTELKRAFEEICSNCSFIEGTLDLSGVDFHATDPVKVRRICVSLGKRDVYALDYSVVVGPVPRFNDSMGPHLGWHWKIGVNRL